MRVRSAAGRILELSANLRSPIARGYAAGCTPPAQCSSRLVPAQDHLMRPPTADATPAALSVAPARPPHVRFLAHVTAPSLSEHLSLSRPRTHPAECKQRRGCRAHGPARARSATRIESAPPCAALRSLSLLHWLPQSPHCSAPCSRLTIYMTQKRRRPKFIRLRLFLMTVVLPQHFTHFYSAHAQFLDGYRRVCMVADEWRLPRTTAAGGVRNTACAPPSPPTWRIKTQRRISAPRVRADAGITYAFTRGEVLNRCRC